MSGCRFSAVPVETEGLARGQSVWETEVLVEVKAVLGPSPHVLPRSDVCPEMHDVEVLPREEGSTWK